MAEAKKQGGEPEQSVEEILQSIRRLLDEEGDPAAAPAAAVEDVKGSDVLELTDMLKDDGSVVDLKSPPPAPSAGNDVMANIEQAITGAPQKKAAPAPAPVPAARMEDPLETLLSNESAKAASSAMKNLAQAAVPPMPKPLTPSMPFRAGGTVEDLVVEALRPMLKQWLDTNLPVMVEKLVDREIRKITSNL